MGYAEADLISDAPIEAIWNALNDIDNTSRWVTGLERAEIASEGSFGQGSIYIDYNRLGPFLQRTAWHVTLFDPMSQQVHVSKSDVLPSTMTLRLFETDEGSYVKFTVDYQFLPKLGILTRLFERLVMNHMLKSVLGQNLRGLNQYLHRNLATNLAKNYQ